MTNAEVPEAPIPDTHVGILETALLATVSTISPKDGLISTNPVSFDWDGEYVRLSTLKSRVKHRNLVANPLVTFLRGRPEYADALHRDPRLRANKRRPGMHTEPEDVSPPERQGTGS
jgi:hypothetical protein